MAKVEAQGFHGKPVLSGIGGSIPPTPMQKGVCRIDLSAFWRKVSGHTHVANSLQIPI